MIRLQNAILRLSEELCSFYLAYHAPSTADVSNLKVSAVDISCGSIHCALIKKISTSQRAPKVLVARVKTLPEVGIASFTANAVVPAGDALQGISSAVVILMKIVRWFTYHSVLLTLNHGRVCNDYSCEEDD